MRRTFSSPETEISPCVPMMRRLTTLPLASLSGHIQGDQIPKPSGSRDVSCLMSSSRVKEHFQRNQGESPSKGS